MKKGEVFEVFTGPPKNAAREVADTAQLALARDVVDNKLVIDDRVAQLLEPNRETFVSTTVAALPHYY